ncbi:hypothetical protein K438DRAFT_1936856 [Mycena galopus ATCC 62051]|nr:hypothetical protein K438DRAFT_1936856 [Mycena galopus ATCC 62051]
MFSLSSLLLAAVASITATAATLPTPSLTGVWTIVDFQGQFFNLVDTQTVSSAPVQGWGDNTTIASQWLFLNSTANQFQIVNVGAGSFLSYSTLSGGGEAIRSQIVGNPQPRTWTFTPPTGLLIDTLSGLAVTSYSAGTSGSNPVCELSNRSSAVIPTRSSRSCKFNTSERITSTYVIVLSISAGGLLGTSPLPVAFI